MIYSDVHNCNKMKLNYTFRAKKCMVINVMIFNTNTKLKLPLNWIVYACFIPYILIKAPGVPSFMTKQFELFRMRLKLNWIETKWTHICEWKYQHLIIICPTHKLFSKKMVNLEQLFQRRKKKTTTENREITNLWLQQCPVCHSPCW